ncbi:MAG TPA: prephenate dehydrogenase/arogenate dehydrogenase family protein [Pyrinomonadaceae bacterium]|nr:prephenate dehydrogenase/arogenate dehydrogenase family protein [Pyrinomonadaceae bacterium]
MNERVWKRVSIVGCGLVGASFALALRRAGLCERIAGWDSSTSVLDEALARGVIDEVDGALGEGAVSSSDLIYLAMPVREIINFLREQGAKVKPGALMTDAGSTKREVCRAACAAVPQDRQFVGGHPVAGHHMGGLAHARADLFEGASYVLIKEEDARPLPALEVLTEAIERLGARVRLLTAREHDRAMAIVSHAPQLVSSALAAVLREQENRAALENLAGAGYRDMTRLASSPWPIWRDILATNPSEIADAVDALAAKLSAVSAELREYAERGAGELNVMRELFEEGKSNEVSKP